MKQLLTVLFAILCLSTTAQPKFLWSKKIISGHWNTRCIKAVDSSGNLFVAGLAADGDTIGGNVLRNKYGWTLGYYGKFNPDGKLLWLKTIENISSIDNLTLDKNENIYLTGSFWNGKSIFDTVARDSLSDVFVAKLTNSGSLNWINFSKKNNFYYRYYLPNINIDIYGNVFVLREDKLFKFNANGKPLWNKSYYNLAIYSISTDSLGQIYFCGETSWITKIGKDSITVNQLGFIIGKIDSTGNEVWVRAGNNYSWSYGNQLIVNSKSGMLFFMAYYQDSFSLGSYNFKSSRPGKWQQETVMGAYDLNGKLMWLKDDDHDIKDTTRRIFYNNIVLDKKSNSVILSAYCANDTLNLFGNLIINHDTSKPCLISCIDFSGNIKWVKFLQSRDLWDIIDYNKNIIYFSSGDYDHYYSISKYVYETENLSLSGKLYYDQNKNGKQDSSDTPCPNKFVRVMPYDYLVGTDISGKYTAFMDTGSYTLSPVLPKYTKLISPLTYSGHITDSSLSDSGKDFALEIIPVHDLTITVDGARRSRPGWPLAFNLSVSNSGTLTDSAEVIFIIDSTFKVKSCYPAFTSAKADTLHWKIPNIACGAILNFNILGVISTGAKARDTLKYIAKVINHAKDSFPSDNTDTLISPIFASYDPNDISVSPWGPYILENTKSLAYNIRFQNTGNDTAYRVVLRDTLDKRFNIETFQVRSASHPYTFSIKNHVLEVRFENIMLPDKGINEPASHGYFAYNIDLNPGLPTGTKILNKAGIYFDYNVPVITNTATSILQVKYTSLAAKAPQIPTLQIYPNPFLDYCTLKLPEGTKNYAISLTDALGRIVHYQKQLNQPEMQISKGNLPPGIYLLNVTDAVGTNIGRAKLMLK